MTDTTGNGHDRLDSWKEIAAYLGRGVTTVQRWEQEEGLPIHRLPHARKGSVFAYRRELDAWLEQRAVSPADTPATGVPTVTDAPGVAPALAAPPRRWLRTSRLIPASLLLIVLVGLAAVAWPSDPADEESAIAPQPGRTSPPQPLRPVPLIASSSDERAPSLSPDGRTLAFALTRGAQGGVFTRALPDGEPQLVWPFEAWRQAVYITKWSPDGTRIAFNSLEGDDTYGLYIIGASGGDASRLTSMAGIGICWTADSRALTFADRPSTTEAFALYSIDIATRQRTRLTTPPAGSFGDTACAWSRDGQRLAFTRFVTRYDADVFVSHHGATAPTRIASGRGGIDDLEWTPDDREIVFTNAPGLRRVQADGATPAADVRGVAGEIGHPTFSRPPDDRAASFAFQQQGTSWGAHLWRPDNPSLHTPWQKPAGAGVEFADLAPDGQRLAYVDGGQVWTADIDGANARQVTFHGDTANARIVTGPRWSPDGRRLAFSVPVSDQRDIYVIDADGANSFRLTSEPSLEDNPSWSNDGRWIYFRSDRGGLNHIWRAPASGGPARQMTTGEGWQALESRDGRSLFFVRGTSHRGLWTVPIAGGQETLVLDGVQDSRWALTDTAVLYVEAADTESPRLRQWRPGGGQPQTLARFPAQVSAGFSASADGRTVVWTRMERRLSDIMFVPAWPR